MNRNKLGWLAVILVLSLGIAGMGQCNVEVEDNNSGMMADFVADLPGSGCIEGSIGIVGDIDFFYFNLSSPQSVLIETITSEDTEITLLHQDGSFIAQNDDAALNVYSSRIERYLLAGTYLVAVWEHNDDNVIYSYTLSVSASGCYQEVEDNNSMGWADPIGELPGVACATGSIGIVGDIDFFSFVVLDRTILTLYTETTEDTEIALLDAQGTVISSNDDYLVGEYWSWIEREVPPGTYYAVVWEHNDDNVIYNYTLVVSGESCISEIEPNDESILADAMGVVPGQVCATGSIDPIGDLDYFEFEVAVATYVTLSTITAGDTEMALLDSFGNTLAVNDDLSVQDRSSWIGMNLAAGVYYVVVHDFSDSNRIPAYKLVITGD